MYTGWQKLVAKLLPWFDPEEQEAHRQRTQKLVEEVGRIESIRIAYTDAGNRLEKRKRAR